MPSFRFISARVLPVAKKFDPEHCVNCRHEREDDEGACQGVHRGGESVHDKPDRLEALENADHTENSNYSNEGKGRVAGTHEQGNRRKAHNNQIERVPSPCSVFCSASLAAILWIGMHTSAIIIARCMHVSH